MMKTPFRFSLVLWLICSFPLVGDELHKIAWVDWNPQLFETSQKENKLVVLDLEAVWCHWCHVMEEKTYSNSKVKELIHQHFIAVRVDQDARPDISRKYEDYGWPATIFFDSKGKELAKRSGFFPPEEMTELLEKLIKNPVPEEGDKSRPVRAAETPFLSAELKAKLRKTYVNQYNPEEGGWGEVHKFLFGETEELALRGAWRGDKEDRKRATDTLTKALALIDPVWGGVYQYSVKTWKEPHFEKIAEAQEKNLVLYSLGYSLTQNKKYLEAAKAIHHFLNTFLRGEKGAYYTSQDADLIRGVHSDGYFKLNDAKRRKKGIPIIDKHQYARENGWFIQGLLSLYAASGDKSALEDSLKAASWIEKERALPEGGFRHDDKDVAGPYLGDTLEVGRAFLKLYEVTGNRSWLTKASAACDFITSNFSFQVAGKPVGFVTVKSSLGAGLNPDPIRDENVEFARFSNLLFHYTGNKKHREASEQAMRYLATPEIAEDAPTAGVLLADLEFSDAPVHMTIVGKKEDPAALALFQEGLKYPTNYRRIDWWDKQEGELPNSDVKYPELARAAAYACTAGRCSFPVFKPEGIRAQVDKLIQ